MREWFWRRKLKKRKHFEDLRSGSVRMWRSEVGLRLERKMVVFLVVLTGLGAEVIRVLEMISVISL